MQCMRIRHHMVEVMTPATRRQIIDMLKAGHPTKAIMAATGAAERSIQALAKRLGIKRDQRAHRHAKNGPAESSLPYACPKALKPWPPTASFEGRNFTKADIALLRRA